MALSASLKGTFFLNSLSWFPHGSVQQDREQHQGLRNPRGLGWFFKKDKMLKGVIIIEGKNVFLSLSSFSLLCLILYLLNPDH
jgi:hypothetical protein